MKRQLLTAFLFGLAISLCQSVACAQSCGSYSSYQRSYARSTYSYSAPSYSYAPAVSYGAPTYSYEAPRAYEAPAKAYEPAYYKFVLALPVAVLPTYGAAYSDPEGGVVPRQAPNPAPVPQKAPSGPDPFQEAVLKKLDDLDRGQKELSRRIEKLERTREPLKLPQPKEEKDGDARVDANFLKVSGESCAACHSRANAAKYGGDFVLSEADGRMAALTAEQREAVETQIMDGKMPKLNSKRAKDEGVKPLTQQTADVLFLALDRQKKAARAQKAPKEG
jgi:hypothetical protein